ncbi:MAG: hypothetical protein ACK5YK_01545 [Pseudomonadota bacterium]|jgi:ABC-type Na+ efflux pump permease subunit
MRTLTFSVLSLCIGCLFFAGLAIMAASAGYFGSAILFSAAALICFAYVALVAFVFAYADDKRDAKAKATP